MKVVSSGGLFSPYKIKPLKINEKTSIVENEKLNCLIIIDSSKTSEGAQRGISVGSCGSSSVLYQ